MSQTDMSTGVAVVFGGIGQNKTCILIWGKCGGRSERVKMTDQAAATVATDLVMAPSQQQVTASNSLVSC